MLFLICMVLNICNFKQRTEQVPVELDISAIEEYILLLLLLLFDNDVLDLLCSSMHWTLNGKKCICVLSIIFTLF